MNPLHHPAQPGFGPAQPGRGSEALGGEQRSSASALQQAPSNRGGRNNSGAQNAIDLFGIVAAEEQEQGPPEAATGTEPVVVTEAEQSGEDDYIPFVPDDAAVLVLHPDGAVVVGVDFTKVPEPKPRPLSAAERRRLEREAEEQEGKQSTCFLVSSCS